MFIRVGGMVTHVQVDGPEGAPVLVLLHSLGTSLHVWDAQARALSDTYRVVRPDLRGHGLSEVAPGPGSIEGFAQDVLALLDALGVGQAHVGGLSLGGMVAQAVAHRAPGRAASLILCDTALSIPPPAMWRDRAALVRADGMGALADAVMARWVTPGFMDAPAAVGLRAMLLRTPPEGYAAAAEAIADADLTERTRALDVPALVLVGEHDAATPPAAAEALRATLGGSLVVLPGAAHIPTVEVPDEVADAIRRFLQPGVPERRAP